MQFTKIISFLKDLNRLDKVKLSIGITTNAYLLNKDYFYKLYKLGLKDVQITIDGFAKSHDKNRMLLNGGRTWKHIISNLDDINNMDLPVVIVIRTNFDSVMLCEEKNSYYFARIDLAIDLLCILKLLKIGEDLVVI